MTTLNAYLVRFNGEVYDGNMVIIAASEQDAYDLAIKQFTPLGVVDKNDGFSLRDVEEIDLTTPQALLTWAGVI